MPNFLTTLSPPPFWVLKIKKNFLDDSNIKKQKKFSKKYSPLLKPHQFLKILIELVLYKFFGEVSIVIHEGKFYIDLSQ